MGSTLISEVDGMVQVYIPSGKFQMGSEDGNNDEQPIHTVYLDAFWMDQTEVTNAMYIVFRNFRSGSEVQIAEGNEDLPITRVDWRDARAYCFWAGRRLPTEAEWEKAARGGLIGAKYPWGDEDPDCNTGAENGAQYADCGLHAVPVGSFNANGYGLYDMAGNVWEWVEDYYYEEYYKNSPDNNPKNTGLGEQMVNRGGSWEDDALYLQSAYRSWGGAAVSRSYIGFRCAQDVSP